MTESQRTALQKPPKGVAMTLRAIWDAECTSMFIQVRGIEMASEFDVSKGKYIESGWKKVRQAMATRLGSAAPWFVVGGDAFATFCEEHGVHEASYLEEVFKTKASEKWKHLQDTFKEKRRRTVSYIDGDGKVVKKKANCTGEQQLDPIVWPFFDLMQQAMLRRPSVCPPPSIILQSSTGPTDQPANSTVDLPHGNSMDSRGGLHDSQKENSAPAEDCQATKKKRSGRPDEGNSPPRSAPSQRKGRRPSNADRRHTDLLSAMQEYTSVTSESFKDVTTCITSLQKQLQVGEMESQVLDRALKIQTNWEERYTFLVAQKIPPQHIISQIGQKPTAEEVVQQVLSLQEILRKTCQFSQYN